MFFMPKITWIYVGLLHKESRRLAISSCNYEPSNKYIAMTSLSLSLSLSLPVKSETYWAFPPVLPRYGTWINIAHLVRWFSYIGWVKHTPCLKFFRLSWASRFPNDFPQNAGKTWKKHWNPTWNPIHLPREPQWTPKKSKWNPAEAIWILPFFFLSDRYSLIKFNTHTHI